MKNMNSMVATMASCALAVALSSASGQDWPQWRGPARDGKSAGFNAPKTWPKELTQTWKVAVGEGVATPALVGDKLFVFARTDGAETTRCLDAATGKELWKDKYDAQGASGPASGFSGPRASPTVADGKVVTLGIRGVLSCLDAADGKVVWRKDDFKGATPRFYTASSPLVADGVCIAEVGGSDNGAVVAYELASGKEKWKWTGDAPAYGSPELMTVDGMKLVIALTDTKIVALTAADGKQVWETAFAVQGRGYNAATPIVDGQTLIYAGSGRGVTAVKLEKKGDAIAATELWKNPDNSVMFNTPVLKNGFIFGFSAANDFFCINAKDGKTAWKAPSAAAGASGSAEGGGGRRGGMGRGGFGTIVDAGSVLLALTPSSELIAFEPTDKAYTEVARIKVADSPTYASPVPSGNRLFVKDQDAVTLWAVK
jgi:outer membrane protein assembly factor BamB